MKRPSCLSCPKRGSDVSAAARALAPWFHNLHLPDSTQTAPEHPLGDFPACKWASVARHLPRNLSGWTVLDVGCNAGFYSIELARRGARVTAIDREEHFLKQARWALKQFQVEDAVELRQMELYELARTRQRFDLVVFMGVFYHLRYPLLGLDIVASKARRHLLFQTLTLPGERVLKVAKDYEIHKREIMLDAGWPKMAFIEHALAGDPSNWWAPNHACVEALLRSTGMRHVRRLSHEIYLCRPGAGPRPEIAAEMRAATSAAAAAGFNARRDVRESKRREQQREAPGQRGWWRSASNGRPTSNAAPNGLRNADGKRR